MSERNGSADIEMRHLRTFVLILETGSITQAAGRLGISQPALSQQVRELEKLFGLPLLTRNGRGVRPTEAGRDLCDRAKIFLADAGRLVEAIKELRVAPLGTVSVGLPPALGPILSVPLVHALRARYPEIRLQLTEGYSGHVREWLASGRVDVGLVYKAAEEPAGSHKLLLKERLLLIGPPSLLESIQGAANRDERLITWAEIVSLPLILPAHPHTIRRMVDQAAARSGVALAIPLEVSAFQTIRDLVVGKVGVTILPASPFGAELATGILEALPIAEPGLEQSIVMAVSSQTHPFPRDAVHDRFD